MQVERESKNIDVGQFLCDNKDTIVKLINDMSTMVSIVVDYNDVLKSAKQEGYFSAESTRMFGEANNITKELYSRYGSYTEYGGCYVYPHMIDAFIEELDRICKQRDTYATVTAVYQNNLSSKYLQSRTLGCYKAVVGNTEGYENKLKQAVEDEMKYIVRI